MYAQPKQLCVTVTDAAMLSSSAVLSKVRETSTCRSPCSKIENVLGPSHVLPQPMCCCTLKVSCYAVQGLEDAIGLSVTHSTWQRTKPDTEDEHCGWAFASPEDSPLQSSTGLRCSGYLHISFCGLFQAVKLVTVCHASSQPLLCCCGNK